MALEVAGGVKKYGVRVVGKKYPFVYESMDPDAVEGLKEIELRTRRSMPLHEHLKHVRLRSMIQSRAFSIASTMRSEYDRIRKVKQGDPAIPEGVGYADYIEGELVKLAEQVEAEQEELWELTKEQVLRLISPHQHDVFAAILESEADPAHINELLSDMESEVIERQKEETTVAAAVDPTLPSQPSGSSDTPTSGPDSDSTELTSISLTP